MAVATPPKSAGMTGRVIAITGPVVDIEFPQGQLPAIFNAVEIPRAGLDPLVCEVQQHLGNNWVRTVAMTTTDGLVFLIIGSAVGGVLAALCFAIGVVSFPLLLDRDIGTAQAVATSIAVSIANWRVLFGWAALIVLFTGAGLITGCLGLIVTMPLIGHASWHAYRDLVGEGT